ncbi:MAG: hypothetical protein COT84_06215 [Chlamydiae bacterium CG10_big_fil_rev_8_21_14_0_10_35_9]|nr:MAG: hypothetical protein COT84_06215 [Chlamydiae bacterium CG10_big_fil_rev_8_21_14_0_10_35_9]
MATRVMPVVFLRYPQIMKMELTARIVISSQSTVDEIRQKAFESAWEGFKSYEERTLTGKKVVRHGNENQVILISANNNEVIKSDSQLQAFLSEGDRTLFVRFTKDKNNG